MEKRFNILVVCGRNKIRSRTAEHIFKKDCRFNIRSAGLSPKSEKKISEKDLKWADMIFVMESGHKSQITESYRHIKIKKIQVLNIEDNYKFMEEELIDLLTEGINNSLKDC